MKIKTKKAAPKKSAKSKSGDNNKTYRWLAGFAFLFFSLYMAMSVFSYILFWKTDQGVAKSPLSETKGVEVANWGGRLGTKIGEFIVSDTLGVFGLLIPIMLIILALRVLRYRPVYLEKSIRICLMTMILGSVTLGYVGNLASDEAGAFGTGLGGAHGIYIAQWIESYLSFGTGLLLLLLIVFLAIYINKNTISIINRFGRGIADKSKDLTASVANKATEYINQQKENRAVLDDEETVTEELTSAEEELEQQEEFPRTVDLDYSFEDDAVEPIQPIVKRPLGFDDAEEESPFKVHTAGEEREESSMSHADGTFQQRFREERVDDFIIRDESAEEESNAGEGSLIMDEDFTVNKFEDETVPDELIETNYDHTLDLSYYQKPPIELLEDHKVDVQVTEQELINNKNKIKDTLENFGIKIDKIKATIGPTVTLYEIVPAPGVRISKIKNLEDDIALSLAALGIRIIAPIPGKGTIGIEVPNKDKEVVSMYSVVKSVKFQDANYELPIVLGKTIQNETYVIDLAKMPHLLVAGATGQGKSVGLNAIITSLLYKKHPSELKFVLVDPKKVELTLYTKLEKHFLAKLPDEDEAIITDTQKVVYTLNSLCKEMDSRYDLLRKAEVRNIKEYNEKFTKRRLNPDKGHRYLPYIVVIIDEFADMIMTAGREVESPIARIAQLARAVGIHLVIATQRPTTNIITGLIKANFPARIAFRVSSMIDSRTIIDQPGANQLIGRGDMLISNGSELVRVQCAFIDTPEVERITEFISNQQGYPTAYDLPEYVPEGEAGMPDADLTKRDPMFEEAARLIVAQQQGSTSLIQRKFSIGYNRAGRIMDQLEVAGIVGRSEGSKPREVKISDMNSLEYMLNNMDTFH